MVVNFKLILYYCPFLIRTLAIKKKRDFIFFFGRKLLVIITVPSFLSYPIYSNQIGEIGVGLSHSVVGLASGFRVSETYLIWPYQRWFAVNIVFMSEATTVAAKFLCFIGMLLLPY